MSNQEKMREEFERKWIRDMGEHCPLTIANVAVFFSNADAARKDLESDLKGVHVLHDVAIAQRNGALEQLTAEREAREKAEANLALMTADRDSESRLASEYKQRAESAEQRNRAAQEQEPFAYTSECKSKLCKSITNYYNIPLYAAPIPPADVAELRTIIDKAIDKAEELVCSLRLENAELTRKLAAADIEKFEYGASREQRTVDLLRERGELIKPEELTKLLEEAKRQAVPEGLRKVSTERLPPEFEKVLHDNLWELYESSSAPQPEGVDK